MDDVAAVACDKFAALFSGRLPSSFKKTTTTHMGTRSTARAFQASLRLGAHEQPRIP